MKSEEFYKDFMSYVRSNRLNEANMVLMKELGRIMVSNREDFIYVLKYAGIEVPNTISDTDLINVFIDNISKNRNLLLGTSFLISHCNKMVGFDGEEYTSNICADAIHKTMYSNFDGDSFSYAGADPVTAIAQGVGELAKLGGGITANIGAKKARQNQGLDLLAKKQAAKQQLLQSVLDNRKSELEQTGSVQKSKRTKMIIIGSVIGVFVIGLSVFAYLKLRRK